MKIIITGAAGLIGSHLCDIFLNQGYYVVGIDNFSFSNGINLPKHPNFTFIKQDLSKTKININADVICHLAAYKKAPKNSIDSSEVMKINFLMMDNIIEFCKNTNTKLLFTSTSDIYGNSKTFDENGAITIGPPNVERYSYALSKLHDEQLVLNCVSENKIHAVIARIFGCASERSNKGWSGGHIPLFIDKALNNQDITIHGDGTQTRSMSHALDIAEGLFNMVKKIDNLKGEIINIGTDEEMTVKESAELIINLCNSKSKIIYQPQEEAFGKYKEIKRRFANTTKAKKLINYKVNYKTLNVIKNIINKWQK